MADQKQVTRIWRCPATSWDETGMRFKRKGLTPHYTIVDGTEEEVRKGILNFTDRKTLREAKKLVFKGKGEEKVLVSGPNYFQDIYGDDCSKVFLDLDDGDFATLAEAQEQTEKMIRKT